MSTVRRSQAKPSVSTTVSHGLLGADQAGDSVESVTSSITYDPNDSHHQHNSLRFKIYALLNVIKFLAIGAVICYVNITHQHILTTKRAIYCCDCYYIARDSSTYHIDNKYRIDWSYCDPDCTDCTYCKSAFGNNATKSFLYSAHYQQSNQSQQCPILNYTAPAHNHPFIAFNEKRSKECPSQLSMNTLELFNKSYDTYGIAAIVIVVLYALLIGAFIYCCRILSGINLLLYNIIISELLFYLMFKPYQYYKREISSPYDSELKTFCQIDSMNKVMEDMMTVFVYCCLSFVLIEWALCSCRCCWNRWEYRCRECYWRIERGLIYFICIVCLLFFVFLIFSSVTMILERWKYEAGDHDEIVTDIITIIAIDVVLLISCIDIFAFKFCREKARRIWKARNLRTNHNYYEKFGRSVSNVDSQTQQRLGRGAAENNEVEAIEEEEEEEEKKSDLNRSTQRKEQANKPLVLKSTAASKHKQQYKYHSSTSQEFNDNIK